MLECNKKKYPGVLVLQVGVDRINLKEENQLK
jgi:hypothetical protein